MRARKLFLILAALLISGAAHSQTADLSRPYQDFLARFWVGDAATGHLAIISQGDNVKGEAREMPPARGWMWQYAEAWNVIYAQWRITKSADAKARLGAEWNWVKKTWRFQEMSVCGAVGRQSATTQDDSSWMSMGLMQLYEATGDRNAMAFAKAAIDCAYKRWHDDAAGGGLWYDDEHSGKTGKQVSNGNIALAMLKLYDATCGLENCDKELLKQVEEIDAWAAEKLARPDGLYWMYVDKDGRNPDSNRPDQIKTAGSVVALFGNMGFAALDARLFAITKAPGYRERAVATAGAILKKETADGLFLDDRDARGNGYAAWDFAESVTPLMPDPAPLAAAYLATAKAVAANDRAEDGSYGGDWGGPVEGIWARHKFFSDRLEITANAVIWPVTAQHFAKP